MIAGADSADLAALDAWQLGSVHSCATPDTGTINRTLLLATTAGDFILRAYRHRERTPVEREHAVIAHARARGIPAVAPIPLPGGGTILEREGHFYALFPRAPGWQVRRQDLGTGEAAAMGVFLAMLHEALRDFPPERMARRSFTCDRDATLAGIERLLAVIGAQPAGDAVDTAATAQLRAHHVWLERCPPGKQIDLTALEQQPIHGDYQETNLFFDAGRVRAVIDWDQTYLAPRAWEALRTLDLAFGFTPALCRAFLDAYRATLPLPLADLDHAAAGYGLLRAHDLWLYETAYLEGNTRVRALIRPGGFIPIAQRWAALRSTLEP